MFFLGKRKLVEGMDAFVSKIDETLSSEA